MVEWKIRRRHQQCSRCEATFDDGTRFVSLLGIDEEEDLLREDLCLHCWEGADPEGLVFFWLTRYRENRTKSLQLDLESLERLFLELEGREQEKLRELRYLISLLLMRKRKLKLVRVARGGGKERLILRRPRRSEELEVFVYDFTAEKLEEMRVRLQEVLEGAGAEAGDEGEPEEPSAGETCGARAPDEGVEPGS